MINYLITMTNFWLRDNDFDWLIEVKVGQEKVLGLTSNLEGIILKKKK